jgi:WD40 repeat protein
LRSFVNDASVFVQYFAMAMVKSAPHVYLSALPFAPTSSLVSKSYSCSFPHTLLLECGQLSHWPSLKMQISNIGSSVESIALSSDGQRIVSGSYDGPIHVWNVTTGEAVVGPFIGHTSGVTSVGFSPDGQWVVSGSR